jgi:hypothetical protein
MKCHIPQNNLRINSPFFINQEKSCYLRPARYQTTVLTTGADTDNLSGLLSDDSVEELLFDIIFYIEMVFCPERLNKLNKTTFYAFDT